MSIPFTIEIEDERFLRADYYAAKDVSRGTLLICHGYKGFKDWGFFPYLGEQMSDEYDVISFNFSHNGIGESLTEFTELNKFARDTYTRDIEDLDVLIKALRSGSLPLEKQPAAAPLYILGHSRGAGVALIYALDHPQDIHGIISWNGITKLDLFSQEEKEAMRTVGTAYVFNARTKQQMPLNKELLDDIEHNAERFDIFERITSSRFPMIIVQGENDFERLRLGSQRLIIQRPDIEWKMVPQGNHTFDTVHPFQGETAALNEAIRITKEWMKGQSWNGNGHSS